MKSSVEKGLLGGLHPMSWVVPAEMAVKTRQSKKALRIGIPKDSMPGENRVPLTPESVSVLTANGHEVYIQAGAGKQASFPDAAYNAAGAIICYSLGDIFTKVDIIVTVSPLSREALDLLRSNQVLLSAVNLGSLSPETLSLLMKKNITAIGFEFLTGSDGKPPLVQMMAEIAGVSSIYIAAELLSVIKGGKGVLLGGVTGIPPTVITVIGGGTVGFNAIRTAIGMGATVKVIDEQIHVLRNLENLLGSKVHSAVSLHNYIEEAILSSDVVIGAAHKHGQRAPVVVTEDMVSQMAEGSVVIDIAIDQGGCIETSHVTTHENPTFEKHGVIHYCVPNIASRVPFTASQAISNILGPLLIQMGDHGSIENLMRVNDGVRQGVYVYRRYLTKQPLSSIFGMDFMDINLLVASEI
jgi:alanine dehydrogenase